MDEVFTVFSLGAAFAWLLSAIALRVPSMPKLPRDMARYYMSWRSYIIALFVITVFRVSLYEMFWIPSASMQPSLREGEFVLVDKNDYGVWLPLLDTRLGELSPERGEIVVFRYPFEENVFYIKRLIGLPGDELVIDGNSVAINGEELGVYGPAGSAYVYEDGGSGSLVASVVGRVSGDTRTVASELMWQRLPGGWHAILLSRLDISPALTFADPNCRVLHNGRRMECTVPDDSYFVMGDNRHRSNDSRFWGFVPGTHLVGPAFTVAVSLDDLRRSFSSLALTQEASAMDGLEPPVLQVLD